MDETDDHLEAKEKYKEAMLLRDVSKLGLFGYCLVGRGYVLSVMYCYVKSNCGNER